METATLDMDLEERLTKEGYLFVRELPGGKWVGLHPQAFTTGLFVGLTETSYERRYCYEKFIDAFEAIQAWDGKGDPPGPWVKEKPSDRLGPGALR